MLNLGDEVEDTITGFSGIAVARHSYLGNPNNISIQPVVEQYGTLPEIQVFAESLLKVTKAKAQPITLTEIRGGE